MKHPTPIQISIPQPCSEDWNKMTPQQQGRFCDSCQKCVVDFTGFTDAQLYQFLAEHHGQKVCGRFRNTQLNRQINIPPQPHSQLYKWIMAAGLALVFVAVPEMKTFARVPYVTAVHDIDTFNPGGIEKKKNKKNTNTDSLTISGYITDTVDESAITNAVVVIRSKKKNIAGTVTDAKGYFELTICASDTGNANLIVSYLGYHEQVTLIASLKDLRQVTVSLSPSATLMGLIEMVILEHDPPLINKFEGGNTKTITSDEIERMAR